MKVFISWSGSRSKNVAEILRNWIPKVLQAIKPWMSEEDISSGTRWSAEIASELEISKVGIVCITPENQHNPWVMFEAGALSKTISETFVCPYLYDLTPAQLSGPMSQFQANIATKEGTFKIIQTLNKALDASQIIGPELDEIFEVWWPKLEERLIEVPTVEKGNILKRSTENILEEILSNSREQMRREEIRLKSFEKREHDMDSLTNTLEGFLKVVQQSSLNLMNSKKEFENLLSITGEDPKKAEIQKDIMKILKGKEMGALFNNLSNPTGPMVDMIEKIKTMQFESQEMNQLLLNPDNGEKPE